MSNYQLTVRTIPEPERSIVAANILSGYSAVGTALIAPCRILYVYNGTDQTVNLSWDGVTAHQTLPAGATSYIDVRSDDGFFAQGTQFYVKQVGVPTTGLFYITSFYGVQ
jgi:hypothetical protein